MCKGEIKKTLNYECMSLRLSLTSVCIVLLAEGNVCQIKYTTHNWFNIWIHTLENGDTSSIWNILIISKHCASHLLPYINYRYFPDIGSLFVSRTHLRNSPLWWLKVLHISFHQQKLFWNFLKWAQFRLSSKSTDLLQ